MNFLILLRRNSNTPGPGQACGRRLQGGREDTLRTVRQQNAGQVRAHQSRIGEVNTFTSLGFHIYTKKNNYVSKRPKKPRRLQTLRPDPEEIKIIGEFNEGK